MLPPASLQEPPPQRYQETSNLCQSNHAKKPFVVELSTTACTQPPPPISTATANPCKTLAVKAPIALRGDRTEEKRGETKRTGAVV